MKCVVSLLEQHLSKRKLQQAWNLFWTQSKPGPRKNSIGHTEHDVSDAEMMDENVPSSFWDGKAPKRVVRKALILFMMDDKGFQYFAVDHFNWTREKTRKELEWIHVKIFATRK